MGGPRPGVQDCRPGGPDGTLVAFGPRMAGPSPAVTATSVDAPPPWPPARRLAHHRQAAGADQHRRGQPRAPGFDAQKAGHGGTLDPLATGVLPIAFGAGDQDRALRDGRHQALSLHPALRRSARHRRCRRARDGHVRRAADRRRDRRRRCPAFRGDIMQVPPAYSAIKVAGERAYDMAREGRARCWSRARRGSTGSSWSSGRTPTPRCSRCSPARASTCAASRATWRAACGTLGHIAALRRLRVGPFTEAQAIPLDKLAAGGGYPARFPGPPASGRDRAGRHPGAGLDRGGGLRPVAWPGDQPGRR